MYLQAVYALLLCCVIKYANCCHDNEDGKLLGRYSKPNFWFWLKRILVYLYLKYHRRKNRRHEYCHSSYDPAKYDQPQLQYDEYGFDPHTIESFAEIERKNIIDSVYFTGLLETKSNIIEDHFISIKLERRHDDAAEIHFFMYTPEHGILVPESYPRMRASRVSCDREKYESDCFTFEVLEPMNRWRISFNGLMKSLHDDNNSHPTLHTKFAFIWKAYSTYFDVNRNTSPWLQSASIANENWSVELLKETISCSASNISYNQWGQLKGLLMMDGNEPEAMLFKGVKDRMLGKQFSSSYHRSINIYGHLENGLSIYISARSQKYSLTHGVTGYINLINGTIYPITWSDLNMWEIAEDKNVSKNYCIRFTAGGIKYTCVFLTRLISSYDWGLRSENKVIECLSDIYVNEVPGRAVCEFMYRQPHSIKRKEEAKLPSAIFNPRVNDYFSVLFNNPACINANLVGGKGTQLAQLLKWNSQKENKCKIPDGFCLTTNALRKHISTNQNLADEMAKLDKISSQTNNMEKLKNECDRIKELFAKSNISEVIKDAIRKQFKELGWFTTEEQMKVMVAVRSSAVDEDSKEMSSAGQLTTILAVPTFDKVCEAVTECWSSMLSFNVLQYRRQMGQKVMSQMGVVIQEMVENPEVSGVMFTMNPITGHPAEIIINANYGLGESVVSGNAEPDTILISRSNEQNLKISSTKIGTKECKMTTKDCGGITEEEQTNSNMTKCCLNEEVIFQLCSIGIQLEKFYDSPRDIEWAVSNDEIIYLFQSRPITNDVTMTTYELEHEFDDACSYEKSISTTANISEMFPGAATPLSLSLFAPAIAYSTQEMIHFGGGLSPTNDVVNQFGCISHNHLHMNYHIFHIMNHRATFLGNKHSLDINIFGRSLDEISGDEIIPLHMNEANILTKISRSIKFLYYAMKISPSKFEKLLKKANNLKFCGTTSMELYKEICTNLNLYFDIWKHYNYHAFSSGLSCNVLIPVLLQGKEEITPELFSDIAMILSKCDKVLSAEVPSKLYKIANVIAQNPENKKYFLESDSEVSIQWLLNDSGEAGELFQKFLKEHGHRALKEAEMMERSWASEPDKLINVLKASVKANLCAKEHLSMSTADTIDKIESPLTFVSRQVLKFLIPMARNGVCKREYGKSMTIKVSDIFKQAYWKLSEMMKSEGFLPEKDLLFFLTHREIGKVIHSRTSSLVSRAIKRKRLHQQLMKMKFPEISYSFPPQPIVEDNYQEENNNVFGEVTLTGMSVSHGIVEGQARVIHDLEDAKDIQPGEVLIVHTTDVGWSPYFPLISGLVTEIGGLLSHGAVVAREYGLPCIVATKEATRVFNTGDKVLLNGRSGTLKKIIEV